MKGEVQRAWVALGSNLGPKERLLASAARALAAVATPVGELRRASLWRTAPVDCPPGAGDFLNTVVEFGWAGTAAELLAVTRAVEWALGRRRGQRHAPRTIDLDLLWVGEERVESAELALPHPRMGLRGFVLEPLAELVPERLLADGRTVAQAVAELRAGGSGGIERVVVDWG